MNGYSPQDGIQYEAFTRIRGIEEKYKQASEFSEYEIAQWFFDIDHSSLSPHYSSLLDDVPVNFISNLDVVGGCSGAPTLNESGHLVGVVFDLNTQGIASNWLYEDKSRTIHVDIRYILWILENRAPHLYKELLLEEGADLFPLE